MKANGLVGEYCQNCAALLDDVQRNHRRVIALDSQCVAVFHQSGDAARLDEIVNPVDKTHTEHIKIANENLAEVIRQMAAKPKKKTVAKKPGRKK